MERSDPASVEQQGFRGPKKKRSQGKYAQVSTMKPLVANHNQHHYLPGYLHTSSQKELNSSLLYVQVENRQGTNHGGLSFPD